MKTYVLYHAGCFDGFGAAWVAHDALGDDATYIPYNWNTPTPPMDDGSRVLMFDVCMPRKQLLELKIRMAEVLVKDHHKSAMDDCKGDGTVVVDDPNTGRITVPCGECDGTGLVKHYGCANCGGLPFTYFDMNHSGAMLAWQHFFPSDSTDWRDVPILVTWLEDKDLWLFKHKDTRAAMAALRSHPMTFEAWNKLGERAYTLVEEGRVALALTEEVVKRTVNEARMGVIGGHQVPIVNSTAHWSEIGEAMLAKFPSHPFSASYYDANDGNRRWQLRSRPDFDVSLIAKQFGGGGHKQAAGFTTSAPPPL